MVKRLISEKKAKELKETKTLEASILNKLETNCGFTKKEARVLLGLKVKNK